MAKTKHLAPKRQKHKKATKEQRKFVLLLEPNDKKRTLGFVVARTGKRIKLKEMEMSYLTSALSRQIREWRDCSTEEPPAETDGSTDGYGRSGSEIVKSWTPLDVLSKDDLINCGLDETAKQLYRLIESDKTYDDICEIALHLKTIAIYGKYEPSDRTPSSQPLCE